MSPVIAAITELCGCIGTRNEVVLLGNGFFALNVIRDGRLLRGIKEEAEVKWRKDVLRKIKHE